MIERVKYHFDAAHRLSNHDGKCRNLHGHRWEVEVCIRGIVNEATGMVIDFGIVKDIIDRFDHTTILKDNHDNRMLYNVLKDISGSCMLLYKEPTAENLAQAIHTAISSEVPGRRVYIKLWESPGCVIEYGDWLKD